VRSTRASHMPTPDSTIWSGGRASSIRGRGAAQGAPSSSFFKSSPPIRLSFSFHSVIPYLQPTVSPDLKHKALSPLQGRLFSSLGRRFTLQSRTLPRSPGILPVSFALPRESAQQYLSPLLVCGECFCRSRGSPSAPCTGTSCSVENCPATPLGPGPAAYANGAPGEDSSGEPGTLPWTWLKRPAHRILFLARAAPPDSPPSKVQNCTYCT